ncbi:MAG: hypothetical protein ORO03_09015, partial [Alphaproteobacteria bacterium]|nr:hypothetical protein [Alphaproteobacteria bacterium]
MVTPFGGTARIATAVLDLGGTGNFYEMQLIDAGGVAATIGSGTTALTFEGKPSGLTLESPGSLGATGGTAVVYTNVGDAGLTIHSSRVTSLKVNYIGANKITVNSGAAAVYNFTNGVKLSASDQIVLGTNIGNSASPTDITDLWLQAGAGGIVSGQGTVSIS